MAIFPFAVMSEGGRIRFIQIVCGIAVTLAVSPAFAQELRNVHLKGAINDYSPSTVAGGPYEIHGVWSLDVQRTGTANFSADLNMETSDYGISNPTAVDPAKPATRSPHTHHLSITNAMVSYDTSVCPANNPVTTGGLVISGMVTTTGNGGPAPFEASGPSTLQVCITGGSQVQFSNLTVVYTGPATGHFGPQAIHGVVSQVSTK